jgi:hypothetical protein
MIGQEPTQTSHHSKNARQLKGKPGKQLSGPLQVTAKQSVAINPKCTRKQKFA